MLRNRRIRSLLVLGTIVGVGVGAVQITGAAAHSGRSVGAPESSLGTYVAPIGPELAPTQVQQMALKSAAAANEANPTEMSLAHGSFAAAQAAMEPGTKAPSNATMALWENSSAYIVVMHGQFTLDAPTPPGRSSPSGPVMALIVDAHTGFTEGEYVGVSTPDIHSLGPVTQFAKG